MALNTHSESVACDSARPDAPYLYNEAGSVLLREGAHAAAAEKFQQGIRTSLQVSDGLPRSLLARKAAWALKHGVMDCAFLHAGAAIAFGYSSAAADCFCIAARSGFVSASGVCDVMPGLWPLFVLVSQGLGPAADTHLLAEIHSLAAQYKSVVPMEMLYAASASDRAAVSWRETAKLEFSKHLLHCYVRSHSHGILDNIPNAPSVLLNDQEPGDTARGGRECIGDMTEWSNSLSQFTTLAMLLTNLAAAQLQDLTVQSSTSALMNAVCALTVQPGNVSALVQAARAASALACEQFPCVDESLHQCTLYCLSTALQLEPANPHLQQLQSHLEVGAISRRFLEPSRDGSRNCAQQYREPTNDANVDRLQRDATGFASSATASSGGLADLATLIEEGDAPLDTMLAEVRGDIECTRSNRWTAMEKNVGMIPHQLEQLFLGGRKFPEGCDAAAAKATLASASDHACKLWLRLALSSSSDKSDPMRLLGGTGGPDHTILSARQVEMSQHHKQWLASSLFGGVRFLERDGYLRDALPCFSDVAQHALPISVGGVHVEVGFFDFAMLAETVAALQESSSECDKTARHDFFLQWVGLCQSPHCVAKTIVLLQMLQDGADPEDIVQVWYSATWTVYAASSFHKSLATVVKSSRVGRVHTSEVKRLLRSWSTMHVPLSEARKRWAASCATMHWVHNLLDTEDQMAACSYALSGDVPVGAPNGAAETAGIAENRVGSVVMWSSTTPIPHDANFLASFAPEALVQERMKCPSFVRAAASLAKRRVQALAQALHNKTLTADAFHTILTSKQGQAQLRERTMWLKPTSMSWSNLCDHMVPSLLHTLAHDCSMPTTKHFMHSVRWVLDVKGAGISDYGFPNQCGRRKKKTRQLQDRAKVLHEARDSIESHVMAMHADSLLRTLPLELPAALCNAMLAKRMAPMWLQAFAKAAPKNGRVGFASCELLHDLQYWPMSKVGNGEALHAAHFVVTYTSESLSQHVAPSSHNEAE